MSSAAATGVPGSRMEDDVPTYAYACTECSHTFEAQQAFTDDTLTECPECAGRLRKLFNAVGIVFKGSGFYRTDSRGKSGAGATSGAGGSSSSSGDSSSTPSTAAASTTSDSAGSSSTGPSPSSGSKSGASSSGASSSGSSSGGSSGSASKTSAA